MPWDDVQVRRLSAAALWAEYRTQLAQLRAAADPAVTDRRRMTLVTRVVLIRIELRRRHLIPSSPREAACRGA